MDVGTVELTELEKLEVTRVDAVGRPANGFPALIMKGIAEPAVKGSRDCPKCDKSYDADHQGDKCENCGTTLPDGDAAKADGGKVDCPTCKGDGKIMGDKRDCPDCDASGKVTPAKAKTLAAKALVKAIVGRKVDESPDIAGGTAVLAQIADLIIAEAQELKSGQAGEIADIQQLACAAEMIWCWRTGEEAVGSGSVMPATALMQSAAKAQLDAEGARTWTTEQVGEFVTRLVGSLAKDRNYSAAERKEMARDGRALPDGSYPISDEHDLNSAAILARSGHGDVEAAKRHIGKRAKELGVKNPLEDGDDDTSKGQLAQEGISVDTGTQGSGDLEKAVADAVTKATASLRSDLASAVAERDSAREELAKVKAQPMPGGPHMSAAGRKPAEVDTESARKAIERFDYWAEHVSDPVEADRYQKLAARERAKLTTS